MPKEKQHFQFLRSSAVYDTLESAKTAIKGLNVKAGEPSIALYKGNGNVTKVILGISPVDGTNKTLFISAEEVEALISASEGGVNTSIGNLENLTTKDKATIVAAINSLKTESTVTVEKKQTAEEGFAATYIIKQNEKQVGSSINIPKDFLVKSGTVKTVSTINQPVNGYKVGQKYLDFVVNTASNDGQESHIYILVEDLVDVYTGSTGDQIAVVVGNDNTISASLTNTVNDSLEKANSALQKTNIKEGTADGTISVSGVNINVHGLGSAAYTESSAYDKANAAYTVKTELIGTNADTKDKDTINGAKKYADAAVTAKNVTADGETGDNALVEASAASNKVTVGSTQKLKYAVSKAETSIQTVNGTEKQIKVTKSGTTVTVGFADDAILNCGEY